MSRNHNRKFSLYKVVFMALWLCMTSVAHGFDRRVVFDRLSLSEGLSQSNIFAFHEDHQGYLWMGTQSAADRFDGYQIQSFRHNPTDLNSLTSGAITGFFQSSEQYLWISTEYGITRFDFATQSMTRVLEVEARQDRPLFSPVDGLRQFCGNQLLAVFANLAWRIELDTLTARPLLFKGHQPANFLSASIMDKDEQIWMSDGEHLWASDCGNQSMVHVATNQRFQNLRSYGTSVIALTSMGQIAWAGTEGLEIFDPNTRQKIEHIRPSDHGPFLDIALAVTPDTLGGLWLLTPKEIIRIRLSHQDQIAHRMDAYYEMDVDITLLENRPYLHVVQSGDGLIWVSVANHVGAYDDKTRTFQRFTHDPKDGESLPPTAGGNGYDLFSDRFGVVWFGAKLGGVARYVPQRHRFSHLKDFTQSAYVVRGVAETAIDNTTHVWVGLDDSGIQLWSSQGAAGYEQQALRAVFDERPIDLATMRIRAMATHPVTGSVWFNSASNFGRLDAQERVVEVLSQHAPEMTRHRTLAFSPDGRYLYQSIGQELIQHEFDPQGRRVGARALDWLPEKINRYRLGAMAVLTNGTLILAAEDELFSVTPWNQQVSSIEILGGDFGQTRFVSMLSQGNRIWLGTRDYGLLETELHVSQSGPMLNIIQRYSEDEGLPDVTIYAIAMDKSGQLWVSSNRGLSRINPITQETLNFSLDDGLQAYEFNTGVVHQAPSGRLYFGGINGVNLFDPSTIEAHPTPPLIDLKRFEVNQINKDPATVDRLAFDENNWVIEYVGIHSVSPGRNQFSYLLEGLDQTWVEAGAERIARYTGLNPGRYRFLVKSANADGVWSEPDVLLEATIAPPPWQSPLAYILYVLLGIVMTMGLIIRARQRELELQRLVDQRTRDLQKKTDLVVQQSSALQEALNARTLFFANVSHELRTPLTLIDANLSTLDQALPNHEGIGIAKSYIKRLVRLVDQLLDLSKIRLHGVQTETTAWSIDQLVESTVNAYQGVASDKGIDLKFSSQGDWFTRADQGCVEKILLNLLTNAVKFTESKGSVTVRLDPDPKSGVWLRIEDTGPGISEEAQTLIFERFYRVPVQESQRISGAGIGLSLVAEAVAAIGGSIELDSRLGEGSTFSVWMAATQEPDALGLSTPRPETTQLTPVDTTTELAVLAHTQAQAEPQEDTRPAMPSAGTLLIVEDNDDLRTHLAKLLAADWTIVQASDGLEALDVLETVEVDVILSDIMMPKMDGLTLLQRVRDDLKTSHIPFLLLTARSDDETELQSLMLSADDFIRKPFESQVLALKLKNLWTNRQKLQARLGESTQSRPEPDATEPDIKSLSPRDHRFLERLSHWIEAHFTDPDLSVAGMADALAVDERTLQRKIRALFDQTPAHFINEYRISRAEVMLRDPTLEIQEIAYRCGYNSGQYFSRVFTKHRGQSPTHWRQHQQN